MFFYFHAVYNRELVLPKKRNNKTRAFNELLDERTNERH